MTYQFAKGKLELGGLEIKQTEFKTEVNTALTSSLGLDDSTIPATAKLAVSAKYGNVALSTSGSFVYTPMTNFKGTESFWVTISNGVSSTTKEIKITVE